MTDLFGYTPPRGLFVDIRNQRDSVADEKATLVYQLNALVKRVPASINGASVNKVRAWKVERETSLKVLSNKRSSRTELQRAINVMREYEKETA
jgi:hypothetical protein